MGIGVGVAGTGVAGGFVGGAAGGVVAGGMAGGVDGGVFAGVTGGTFLLAGFTRGGSALTPIPETTPERVMRSPSGIAPNLDF